MTEDEIKDKVNQICEGKFEFMGIQNVNHSQGHPYTIGPRHVVWASEHFSGMLGEPAITEMENQKGPSCCHPGCNAYYHQHTSEKGLFLKLLKNLENKEAADVLYQVRLQILEPEKIAGIAFVNTPEGYRIARATPDQKQGGDNG